MVPRAPPAWLLPAGDVEGPAEVSGISSDDSSNPRRSLIPDDPSYPVGRLVGLSDPDGAVEEEEPALVSRWMSPDADAVGCSPITRLCSPLTRFSADSGSRNLLRGRRSRSGLMSSNRCATTSTLCRPTVESKAGSYGIIMAYGISIKQGGFV